MSNVSHHVAPEEQIAGAVELGAGRFPRALGILPTHPFDEIVLDQRVGGSHAADAFDADIAQRIAAHDMRIARLRIARAGPVLAANVQPDTAGPFNRVAFDDPVMAAAG